MPRRRRPARHRADQARRGRRRADADVRRPRPCRRILSRPADQGRPPGRHRRADRKPRRSPQGARLQGAGRARDRPAGHSGDANRGSVARRRQRPTGSRRSARAGDEWAIAAADISTGRFELVACGPGELEAELARLSPAETIAEDTVPGIDITPGKGGFDSLAGEQALKGRFGVATLDGFGLPAAPSSLLPADFLRISKRPKRMLSPSSLHHARLHARRICRSTRPPAIAWRFAGPRPGASREAYWRHRPLRSHRDAGC